MIEQRTDNACYIQFESFQHFPNLIHGIFTREGGYSEPPYKGLNTLGSLRGGDNLDNVVRNRQLALHSLALDDTPCVTLWNVHGAEVFAPDVQSNGNGQNNGNRETLAVSSTFTQWRSDWAYHSYYTHLWAAEEIHKGDALITQQRGVALALSFADCTPIALYDPVTKGIGIAHGGWRGTARGVVLATIDAMIEKFGSSPEDIYAGIGPAIGPCCYEVSQDVQNLFMGQEQFSDMPTHEQYRDLIRETAVFSTVSLSYKESLRLDLWETNRRQLLMAGLLPEHIEVAGICTACNVDYFFSHRAEHGKTGRFPMIVALAGDSVLS